MKMTIIGAGNMGGSLLLGLIQAGFSPADLTVADPDQNKLATWQQKFNIHIMSDNLAAVSQAEVILLAIKPQQIRAVAEEIAPVVAKNKPLVISIAAGVLEESIQKALGGHVPIVRCMPNTPALIGCGMSALYANQYVTQKQQEWAMTILQSVGKVVWLSHEKQMDAVTALSGSGPAYFFLVIEALQAAGEKLGLPKDMAKLLTLQTAYGAACMALDATESISGLRSKVTSPGGTTQAAIKILEENNLSHILFAAVQAAEKRSEELAALM